MKISKPQANKFLRIFLTALTLVLFAYYFSQHLEEFRKLKELSISSLLLIWVGMLTILLSNVFMLIILVRMVGKKLPVDTSARVIGYSSLINFFGFLQGGLGFRAIYLKRYLGVSIKAYTALTILQYLSVFGVSIFMICLGLWLIKYSMLPLIVAISLILISLIFKHQILNILRKTRLSKLSDLAIDHNKSLIMLIGLSVVQFSGSAIAYAVELTTVGAHFSFGALLIFTGVAQFAILIALTPGAIGIRESLLFLVQGTMSISASSIILAGTIDRLAYSILLLALIPYVAGFRKKVEAKSPNT